MQSSLFTSLASLGIAWNLIYKLIFKTRHSVIHVPNSYRTSLYVTIKTTIKFVAENLFTKKLIMKYYLKNSLRLEAWGATPRTYSRISRL